MNAYTTLREANHYLDSFINYEKSLPVSPDASFRLERVRELLSLFDHPEKKLKFIHVAGTKGKGSTCAFAAHILRAAGYSVGLYTSPHIHHVRERIRILRPSDKKSSLLFFEDCIPEDELCSLVERMQPFLERMRETEEYGRLTYFEVLTVLALCYFEQQKADIVVLETGLGGRLDATNVVDPLVCGITSIGLEHTQQLGETLSAIAQEKAAIIKNRNNPVVVIAPQEPEAYEVIQKQCQQEQVQAYFVGRDISFQKNNRKIDGQSFVVKSRQSSYHCRTSLLGDHQMINAATAIGLVEGLQERGINVSAQVVEEGIAQTFWPGRFEVVREEPGVVLDCAHTVAACQRVAETVESIFPGKKVKLILGLLDDKDKQGICQVFGEIASHVACAKVDNPRACDFRLEEIQLFFPGIECCLMDTVRGAVDYVLKAAHPEDVVLVTGSVYLVAEARELLLNTRYQ